MALTCLVWPGNGDEGADYKLLPGGPDKAANGTKQSLKEEVSDL